jgi:hypothetical protein
LFAREDVQQKERGILVILILLFFTDSFIENTPTRSGARRFRCAREDLLFKFWRRYADYLNQGGEPKNKGNFMAALKYISVFAGLTWTAEELLLLGQKIYREKMALKKLMGFQPEQVLIPARFLETTALKQQLSPEKMEQLRRLMVEKLSAITLA